MDALARLLNIGFIDVGAWSLEAGCPRCALHSSANSRNVLYAFVAESEVLYVGKTIQSLNRRMRGYEKPSGTQTTNIRGSARLVEILAGGGSIRVFALPDNGLLHYGGFHVNLAAGLEDSIIRDLKPRWNMTGVPSSGIDD